MVFWFLAICIIIGCFIVTFFKATIKIGVTITKWLVEAITALGSRRGNKVFSNAFVNVGRQQYASTGPSACTGAVIIPFRQRSSKKKLR